MGWKAVQDQYRQQKTLASQPVEDLVARRVLRGLGLVQRQLPQAERAILGHVDSDMSLWNRVSQIWKYLDRNGPCILAKLDIEVVESKPDHKDIIERFEIALSADFNCLPIFLTRVKNTKISLAYSAWDHDGANILRPPYNVISAVNNYRITVQATTNFVEQFGPYDLSIMDSI